MSRIQAYGLAPIKLIPGDIESIGRIDKAQRKVAIRNGTALTVHAKSAHGGVVSPTCPACIELRRKMEAK
jgi:hypothetical protein